MAAEKSAKIVLSVEGLDDVIRAAQKSKDAWTRASGHIAESVQSAGKELTSTFRGMVDDVTRVATAAAAFNFAEQIAGARKLREETSRMAIASGQDVGLLADRFKQVGKRILETPDAVAAFTKGLGRATYDMKGAAAAATGLGLEALNTGKSLEEMGSLGVVMKSSLGVTGDTTKALGMLRAQADALGTTGGVAALHDSLTALGPVLDQMSAKAGGARNAVTALAAGIHGPSAGYNKRVAGALLGDMSRDARGYERLLGMNRGSLTNEFGQFRGELAPDVLEKSKAKLLRMAHGDKALAAQMAGNMGIGAEAGAALIYGAVDIAGMRKAAKVTPKAIPEAFAGTAAGQQLQAQLAAQAAKRDTAEAALPYVDAVEAFTSKHMFGSMIGAYLGGGLLKGAGSWAIKRGAGMLARGVIGAGSGAGAAGAGGAGMFTLPVIGQLAAAGALGFGAGTLADNYFDLSGRAAGTHGGAFNKQYSSWADADPEQIRARQLSTVRTIQRNVEQGIITPEEGDKRLAGLEGQTQKLLGAAGLGGGGAAGARDAAAQTAALHALPKATGDALNTVLRASPLQVVIVEGNASAMSPIDGEAEQ